MGARRVIRTRPQWARVQYFADPSPAPPPAAYTQLANFTGQWDIQIYLTKDSDKNVFTPQSCNATAVDATCNVPGMSPDAGDKVKVQFGFNGTLRTLDGAPAKTAVLKFCFSKPFFTDRPWRKYNTIIAVSARSLLLDQPPDACRICRCIDLLAP